MGSHRVSLVILFSALLLAVTGCGDDGGADPNESATTRAIRQKVRADLEVDRLNRLAPRLAHVNAALADVPSAYTPRAADPALSEDESSGGSGLTGLARGESLYTKNCASCHGARGGGDGPVAASLVPQPAKHSDGGYMNALSNDHLYKVIAEGGTAVGKSSMMAPWGMTFSEEEIWDVIEFLRTLADPPYAGSVR